MILDMKRGILYRIMGRSDKKFILTPNEKMLIGMLSNNKYITYDEINRFVYKDELSHAEIKSNLNDCEKRFGMSISTTPYRAKISNRIDIR